MSKSVTREAALEYHRQGKPGKIEVVPTKPYTSQRDLALAYSPGVAYPCKEIEKNPNDVYEYTDKGNLVAVISNGTVGARSRQYRTSRWKTGYGGQGAPF